ncbi:hypothetical protein NP493_338g02090 [Ridgeia piscesae]|uniref:Uncharacterized protein n=1 Tax=Ridgeia piscesae TaxID=27915 RepID=A0AAD9NTY5_RIDPI|nr:hypothetical protein NP493_338g02090 [Ridgeia piscesae]
MVLEDLFLLLHFCTRPQPVHHISTRPYSFLPVQMMGGRVSTLYIKLCFWWTRFQALMTLR